MVNYRIEKRPLRSASLTDNNIVFLIEMASTIFKSFVCRQQYLTNLTRSSGRNLELIEFYLINWEYSNVVGLWTRYASTTVQQSNGKEKG